MAKRDYYEILGVSKGDDEQTIKKAYRKIAMQYHPDRNPGDSAAEDKFKEAAEAYEVLSNAEKRARYDQYGHAGMGNGGGFGRQTNMDMDDIFRQYGDIFGEGSPFESFFGGGGRSRSRRTQGRRGSDLRIKVSLTLEDIANGVTKKIKVKKQVGCTTCNGSGAKNSSAVKNCGTCGGSGMVRQIRNTFLGQMETTTTCPTCHGSGKVVTDHCNSCAGKGSTFGEETIEIKIPAGVSSGMQLSLSGKGNAGQNGGPHGDLLVSVEEVAHDLFERDGNNLIYDFNISYGDAVLGTSIEVPTIDGKVKVKVPAGTPSGKVFRLKGKGLPSVQSYDKGDQLIVVNIFTPKKISEEEKALLEKMMKMPGFSPIKDKTDKSFFERMKDLF
jgi:molecular chaperone DnaJ